MTSNSPTADVIRTLHALFPKIPDEAFAALAAHAALETYVSGQIVSSVSQGLQDHQEGRWMAFIAADRSVESIVWRGGKPFVAEVMGPGDVFGLSVHDFSMQHRAAGRGKIRVVTIPLAGFRLTLQAQPAFGEMVLDQLAKRHLAALDRAADLAVQSVSDRVWNELKRMAAAQDGDLPRINQQQLADRLGTCRETVSRVLQALRRDGRLARPRPGYYLITA